MTPKCEDFPNLHGSNQTTSYKIDRKSCFVQDVKTCPSKKTLYSNIFQLNDCSLKDLMASRQESEEM